MLPLLTLRFASRRALLAFPLAKPAASSQLRSLSYTATRSFLASTLRAEPSKAASKSSRTKSSAKRVTTKVKPTKSQAKTKPRASAKKATPKKRVVKAVNKPTKPKKVLVPRGLKIPPRGPSVFTHYLNKYYRPNHDAITGENFRTYSAEAAKEWKVLPQTDRERITEEAQKLRLEAAKTREEYLRTVSPLVMREINRRRSVKGKPRVIVHRPKKDKKPMTSYIIFSTEYREKHRDSGERMTDLNKKAGEEWRQMTDEAKEPYVERYKEAQKAWLAAKETK